MRSRQELEERQWRRNRQGTCLSMVGWVIVGDNLCLIVCVLIDYEKVFDMVVVLFVFSGAELVAHLRMATVIVKCQADQDAC